ncbi:MAG TPA: ComEC/Rec2 family competence protein [Thermomicrobiales bacterium]|nr:ComEC/Rec2 family competence protein [Thermomicrobiales bacterium]
MTGILVALAALLSLSLGWKAAAVIVAAAVAWVAFDRRRLTYFASISLIVAAGLAGAVRSAEPASIGAPAWLSEADAIRGRVVGAPTTTGRVQQFVVDVEQRRWHGAWTDASGDVCVAARPYPALTFGDRAWVGGRIDRIDDQANSIASWMTSRGCGGTLFAYAAAVEAPGAGWLRDLTLLRRRMTQALQDAAPGDAGVLLSGFVTGDDQALTDARQAAFRRTSTVHLTTVSGANLALLVALIAGTGSALGVGRRLGWHALIVAGVWLYALLVGLEPPAFRAAVVATAAILAIRVGRRPDFVTLVLLAGAAEALIRPEDVWSLSFRLSLASSLALSMVMSGLPDEAGRGWGATALLATAVAQLATLPLLLPVSGSISLLAIPVNLAIGPLAEAAFPLAAAASVAGVVWRPLGEMFALPARALAEAVIRIVDFGGAAPWGLQPLGAPDAAAIVTLAAGVGLAVLWASADFRNWTRRAPDDVRMLPPRLRLAGVGLAVGAATGLVVRAVV